MTAILYLDCPMGLAGDMTLAALLDAGADAAAVQQAVRSIAIEGVTLAVERTSKNGFAANRIAITHPEQHVHRGLSDCLAILEAAAVPPKAASTAAAMFRAIAVAEAKVHGSPLDQVHFHEVGAIDSIVDIIGCAVALESLQVDTVRCGPVPVGRGSIRIAHGVCPLPAPATAELLVGIPLAESPVEGELTTPTGAAFVRETVDQFGPLPPMTLRRMGYGAGTRSYPHHPNLLRAMVGTLVADHDRDTVDLLETNLDDVSGEIIGHTRQRLLAAGALDVFVVPIDMKKDRPGSCLSVLCHPPQRAAMESILFDETGTLGIRRTVVDRTVRERTAATVETPYGVVSGKSTRRADGKADFTPEFDACRDLAVRHGVPVRDVYRAAQSVPSKSDSVATTAEPSSHHDHSHDRSGHSHDHGHDHDHGLDHSHDRSGHSHG